MYYVYVLQSVTTDRHYLGYSSDLKERLKAHNEGNNRSTRHSQWRLVYYEAYTSAPYARQREASLKRNERMRSLLYKRIEASMKTEPFSGGGSS